jgi:hypothetical protein
MRLGCVVQFGIKVLRPQQVIEADPTKKLSADPVHDGKGHIGSVHELRALVDTDCNVIAWVKRLRIVNILLLVVALPG